MIRLEPISPENFEAVIALQAALEQSKFVASNLYSIAQAKVYPECVALAAFDNDQAVGFAMYCVDRDDNEWWLYRLMVEETYQGRGYGRAALQKLLELVQADRSRHRMYLGVDLTGKASVRLYQSLGFRFDGRVFGKEHIMVLEY